MRGTARVRARKLQAGFDGFRAAVGEERAVQAGKLAELFRQPSLVFVVEKIRNVKRPLDLFSQNLLHSRMVVTQRINADTRQQIQISLV